MNQGFTGGRLSPSYSGEVAMNTPRQIEEVFPNVTTFDKIRNTKNPAQKSVSFYDEIKIDFIESPPARIGCRFLNISSFDQLKKHPLVMPMLLGLVHAENIIRFMESKNYTYEGELKFDESGKSIPVNKEAWIINKKEIIFTSDGFLYFRKNNKKDGIIFSVIRGHDCMCYINCLSKNTSLSEKIITDLKKYTKENNCLRKAKLKDIHIYESSFQEVNLKKECTWENYYYEDDVKTLIDTEIIDFMENIKIYNEKEIYKRGIMFAGQPGTGKSTLVHTICNQLPNHTVLWITPEIISENKSHFCSEIKLLYSLAELVAPSIIVLEDLDLFSNNRENGGDLMRLGALMNILDGVNSIKNSITIGTTNRLESIEEAIKNRPGRFDRIIEINALSKESRYKMLKNRLNKWNISEETFNHIVEKTDEWTGAAIQEFVNTLNINYIKNKHKHIENEQVDEIIEKMIKFSGGDKMKNTFGFNISKE